MKVQWAYFFAVGMVHAGFLDGYNYIRIAFVKKARLLPNFIENIAQILLSFCRHS